MRQKDTSKIERKGMQDCSEASDDVWIGDSWINEETGMNLEEAEMKMLRLALGVWVDKIKNEHIRGTTHVGRLQGKLREGTLRWFGHAMRREEEYMGKRLLKRARGRPKRRFMDAVKEDVRETGLRDEDATDRQNCRRLISCGDP